MIEFRQITKRYGPQEVLSDVSFRVNQSERIGIVGPNGGGKSTLFALIDQTIEPDKGDILLPKQHRLGHVHQQLHGGGMELSLLEYTEQSVPGLDAIAREISDLEHQLAEEAEQKRPRLMQRIGDLQARYEHLGGYEMRNRAEAALSGLGFAEAEHTRPFREFSGGWQMRAELARTLIGYPDTLLLDEPSNYLDVPAVEWLSRFLKAYSGTLLLISHDRYLLESLSDLTLEVSHGQVTRYAGGYSYYVATKEGRLVQLEAAQKSQDRKRAQMERFIERFRSKNTKASQVQSRIKMLDRIEQVEVPRETFGASRIQIAAPPHCGNEIVRLEKVSHSYDAIHWVLRDIDFSIERGEKLGLVGYNGMGKTTLLRILSGGIEPAEGQRILGHNVVEGYQSQDFAETMPPAWSAIRVVKSASPDATEKEVRTILGSFGFSGPTVEKEVSVLSGGEKIRLAFARLFIRPPNFLLLDEPTTHLDLPGRRALEAALKAYEGTICLVSHDIEFVRNVADGIIAMTPPGITRYLGGYDYYCEKAITPGLELPDTPRQPAPAQEDKKTERRKRAQQREKNRARQLEVKRAMRKAEKKIEALESEQKSLVEQLSEDESLDYAATNRRLSEIQAELEIESAAWEEAVEALNE
jgi:ATP-binding cassette subfamily F protein 3